MAKLPKFLFAENKTEAPGAQFIVSTGTGVIGQVIKGYSNDNEKITIPGYRIAVIQIGYDLLDPNGVPVTMVLSSMAHFYLEQKIKPNLKYYERYKV